MVMRMIGRSISQNIDAARCRQFDDVRLERRRQMIPVAPVLELSKRARRKQDKDDEGKKVFHGGVKGLKVNVLSKSTL